MGVNLFWDACARINIGISVIQFLKPTMTDRLFKARVARLELIWSHMIISYMSIVVFLIRKLLFSLPGIAIFLTIPFKKET